MLKFYAKHFFVSSYKLLLLSVVISVLVGSASAIFLIHLDWATNFRDNHTDIIWGLPFIGIAIAAIYHYWGKEVVKGNNHLLEEVDNPKNIVPLKMAPLVYIGTILTHLFGGSAGREGTAVQMGGSIADQFTTLFKLDNEERKIILIVGISAGFASIFDTPLAGAIFALEVLYIGRIRYQALLPSLIAAFVAHYVCEAWPIHHTVYTINTVPPVSFSLVGWSIFVGILFGLTSRFFAVLMHKLSDVFQLVKYPLLRPFLGGLIVIGFVYLTGVTKYIGLGIPVIVESFTVQQEYEVFFIKILLTVITLSAGFKGGEVTPLFFIGATLGSALSLLVPLPVGLLAGMGFVAVFAGATNTPVACVIMGVELFGLESVVYLLIACLVAYLCSGHHGIYKSQKGNKWEIFRKA